MKGLNLDFKKIAVGTLGKGAGLAIAHQVNKIGFIQKQKPMLRALAFIGIGEIVLPMLADKLMGGGKKSQSEFLTGASAGVTTYGTGVMLSNIEATKNFVPAIAGYEDPVYLGAVYDEQGNYQGNAEIMNGAEEEEAVNGYEENVFM